MSYRKGPSIATKTRLAKNYPDLESYPIMVICSICYPEFDERGRQVQPDTGCYDESFPPDLEARIRRARSLSPPKNLRGDGCGSQVL
jgi:hypothetical protein